MSFMDKTIPTTQKKSNIQKPKIFCVLTHFFRLALFPHLKQSNFKQIAAFFRGVSQKKRTTRK